jgi:ankyrin repeat protein
MIQLFLEASVPVDLRSSDGRTALHEAVSGGNLSAVCTLVDAGADVNALNRDKAIPLSLVKGENAVPIAELLIKAGSKIESKDWKSFTPLHHAVLSREVSFVVCLIKAGADVKVRDERGNTPLHLAARDKKGGPIAKVLIEAGADLQAINMEKETALMVAERSNSDVYNVLQATLADN